MLFMFSFKQVFLSLKYFWFWIITYLIIYYFGISYLTMGFLRYFTVILIIFISPFFGLLLQYLFFSFSVYKLTDKYLYVNTKKYDIQEISDICLVTSENRNLKNSDTPSYLPWMSGALYYFKITLKNGHKHYLTCFLDNSKAFENILNQYKIDYKSKFSFFPIII